MVFDRMDVARRFLESLRQSETLPADHWPAYQTRLLEQACRHAAREAPFYRDRLSLLFEDGDAARGRFSMRRWTDVPVLTRDAAQETGDGLFAQATPPGTGEATTFTTSGSTERALTFRKSALAQAAGMAIFERILEWHGVDPSLTLCWIRFDPELVAGPKEVGRWNLSAQSGKRFELSKAANSRDALEWLIGIAPHVLMTTPSMVEALVVQAERSGRRPEGLAFVIVTSETPPEGLHDRVASVFGAKLVDHYGARETGEVAIQCPENASRKHVCAETMLVEIVDNDGHAVAPGQPGRVVVTPFFNYATPLIRYDLGDIAVQGDGQCRCGRTLPTIRELLGRRSTMLRFRDGTRRWPTGLVVLFDILQATQLQFVQLQYECFEVRYVPKDLSALPDLARALSVLRDRIHTDVEATFRPVHEIARGPGGKYEWFISHVADT